MGRAPGPVDAGPDDVQADLEKLMSALHAHYPAGDAARAPAADPPHL
jgi:hypothetical protein